jgi:hypothetical protein
MPITYWSFSAWELHELCPAKFKYEKLDKLPTSRKPYFDRGNKIHKHLEDVVRTHGGVPLDPALVAKEQAVVAEIAAHPSLRFVEQQWGFTQAWGRADWFKATFRLKADVFILYDGVDSASAEFVDWKSGHKRNQGADQMELSALAAFYRFPKLESVATRLVYVDKGGQSIADFSRDELGSMTAKWEYRANQMFAETKFLPRPNERCGQCDFNRAKGGPCRYG